jgi:hypothetical protein
MLANDGLGQAPSLTRLKILNMTDEAFEGVCPLLEKSLSAVPRTQLSPRHKRVPPARPHTLNLDCPVRDE